MSKVDCFREKVPEFVRNHPTFKTLQMTKCLPFYRASPDKRVHRVRSGQIHYEDRVGSKVRHMSFKFWCGNNGFIGGSKHSLASLFAIAPDPAIFCATCEGRAIGAGLDGARKINGRPVLFLPREPRKIHWKDEQPTPHPPSQERRSHE